MITIYIGKKCFPLIWIYNKINRTLNSWHLFTYWLTSQLANENRSRSEWSMAPEVQSSRLAGCSKCGQECCRQGRKKKSSEAACENAQCESLQFMTAIIVVPCCIEIEGFPSAVRLHNCKQDKCGEFTTSARLQQNKKSASGYFYMVASIEILIKQQSHLTF